MAYLIFLKLQKFRFITLERKHDATWKASNLVLEVLYLGINDFWQVIFFTQGKGAVIPHPDVGLQRDEVWESIWSIIAHFFNCKVLWVLWGIIHLIHTVPRCALYLSLWCIWMSSVICKQEMPSRPRRQKLQVEIRGSWSWDLIIFLPVWTQWETSRIKRECKPFNILGKKDRQQD